MPTTWTYVKRVGAPAGQITFQFSSGTFVINDTTQTTIVTTNPTAAQQLGEHPYLVLQGTSGSVSVPPQIQDPVLADGILSKPGPSGTIIPFDGSELPVSAGGITVVQDEGVALTARSKLNFTGAGVSGVDDAANSRTTITIPGGAPSFGSNISAVKTANYTLTGSDEIVRGNATAGTFTFTLPTAVGFAGHYVLKSVTTNSNLITVATTSSQTIDGATSVTLGAHSSPADYNSLIVVSDGANWMVI